MKIEITDDCISQIILKEMKRVIDSSLSEIRSGRLGLYSYTNPTYNDACLSQVIAAAFVIHNYYSNPDEEIKDD
jgi:hypothetical protein